MNVEDIEHQFTTEEFDVIQGCTYSSGKIIALSGLPYSPYNAEPAIRFIDPKTGEVETYWLDDYAVTDEPEMVSVDPETGIMYYAAIDGKLRVFKFADMHFHGYDSVVALPTCTEQGYTTHTCHCGDSYVDSYVEALGHSYVDGVCEHCGEADPNAVQMGDANGDGEINFFDAILILQYYTEEEDNSIHMEAADVNGDGEINYLDAMMILQYYVGDLESFPTAVPKTPAPVVQKQLKRQVIRPATRCTVKF